MIRRTVRPDRLMRKTEISFCKKHYVCFCRLQEKSQKEALTRKQQKNRKSQAVYAEEEKKTELLQRPKEYTVKFTFPSPPSLSPPILGAYSTLVSPRLCNSNILFAHLSNHNTRKVTQLKSRNRLDTREDTVLSG